MTINDFVINNLSISTSRSIYEPNIYDHCYSLLSENNDFKEAKVNFNYNKNFYEISEFDYMENLHKNFTGIKIYDYNYIDEVNEKLKTNLKSLLKEEYTSEFLKPIIKFTTDKILKYATLEKTLGTKIINPWKPIKGILDKGLLIYGTDKKDELLEYNKRFKKENIKVNGHMGFIVKGKHKPFGGLVIDDRFNLMITLLKFLEKLETSHHKPIQLKFISEYISRKTKQRWTDSDVQIALTTPMKKMGMIGSTKEGFFKLNNIQDIQESYCFHLGKSISIDRILRTYTEMLKKEDSTIDPTSYCENKHKNVIHSEE
ncbi:hypothetical protein P3G55_17575 [Leptospira sp. 96542]|nr:hypothetical protein [Leptospira sp. 96542]